MKRSSMPRRIRRRRRSNAPPLTSTDPPDQEHRVGPGRPPKEYQFKPGQSGNPKGAPRKLRSIAPDLKALFERALSAKVTLRQGEQEKIITKAAAGIEQLVNQFAKGDRHARRDLFALAARLGVDLVAGHGDALERALRRRSLPMTRLCWTITCGGTPSRATVRTRSMRTAVAG
jgi:hypothetical protein